MGKFFKILMTIFNCIIMIALVIVIVLWATGIYVTPVEWALKNFMYIYGVAAIIVIFKTIVFGFTMMYEVKITKRKGILDEILAKQKAGIISPKQDEVLEQELVPFIETVKQIPEVNTDAIVDVLQERLPEVVQTLVDKQVAEIKENMTKENEERIREINILSAGVSDVLDRRNYLLDLEKEIKQHQEEERKKRLALTTEYTMLVFSLAGTPVEDVEKVCDVVKLFIETGQVSANKDLHIPLNKKLRNAELKQFVTNIIKYNGKDYLDGDSFLQTAFGEWFSGKKENIAKNYSVLPKDSLVSKDGVEADLDRLRKLVSWKKGW